MSTKTLVLAPLALLLIASVGCSHSEEIVDEIRLVPVRQAVSVDVESFAGSVSVRPEPGLEEAVVEITREARFGEDRDEEALASLDQIDFSVDLQEGERGPVLLVRTWSDHPEPHFQRANVRIVVPALEDVDIQTTRGRVEVVDFTGGANVATTEGDARLMTNWPITDDVAVTNFDGDIDYRIRGDSTGAIDLGVVGGEIELRNTVGARMQFVQPSVDRILATLNRGANRVTLRTVDGDVRVAIVPDPTDVGFLIFDP